MLQLSEKWVRCESISGRDAETKIKPPRRLHQSPPLQTNVKVGQPPVIPYTADEIDFIAAYVVAHDAWYIIPVAEIGNLAHIRLYPEGAKRADGAHFEKYREAWDLLRRGAARPAEL